MTTTAKTEPNNPMQDDDYKVHELPLVEIFSDDEFNCRGRIAPIDVIDLAKSVQEHGLQQPIMVQPYNNAAHPGKKYRIVAGHRRYMAYRVNKAETIPAMIKTKLSELQARLFNLTENIKRENLNILQEATALIPFKKAGWQQEYIAEKVGMSRGWVQVRMMLLDLPIEIQAESAAGILTQEQIRQLYSMPNNEERFAAVRLIKDRREKGEKPIIKVSKAKPHEKKYRNQEEMFALQEYIQEQVGNSVVTRLLGWCGGVVSTLEIHRDLQAFFQQEKGKPYKIPEDLIREM